MAVLPPALLAACLLALGLVALRLPRSAVDRVYTGFAAFALRVGGTPLQVRGLEHVEPGAAYVVVANHESNWDPIALVAALGRRCPVRFLAKREIIRIPILGRTLLRTGNVEVERTNTQADVERIRRRMAERPLDVSVLVYAEGTRSRDGALHAFKKGGFVTAIAYGLPVLPVGHAGCRRIWPPETLRFRGGPVSVEVGRPIPVDALEHGDRDELRDQTHDAVCELRARARKELRALGVEPGGID